MRRSLSVFVLAAMLVGLLSGAVSAKSIGGCPARGGWERVTVESLGIPENEVSGIPSLDGNGDGLTCIRPVPAADPAVISGAQIFRDNTVGATS